VRARLIVFAATLDFLLVGGSFRRNAYLALGPDRNALGARRFLLARSNAGSRFLDR